MRFFTAIEETVKSDVTRFFQLHHRSGVKLSLPLEIGFSREDSGMEINMK